MADVTRDRDWWMRRAGPFYPGLVALWRLTAWPLPRGLEPAEEDAARSAPWFPVVGAGVGLAVAIAAELCLAVGWVPALAALLAVIATRAATRAELDRGLAGVVDSPGSGRSRAAPGAMALVAIAAVRWAGLWGTSPAAWAAALVIAPLAGRWAVLALLFARHRLGVPDAGLSPWPGSDIPWPAVAVSSAVTLVIAVIAGAGAGVPGPGILGLGIAAAVALAAALYARRRGLGLSAEAVSAVACACELAVLLVFAAARPALVLP